MTSKRQFEANLANAKKSTGPNTKVGKSRSSRNALRHGLARLCTGEGGALKTPTTSPFRLMDEMSPVAASEILHSHRKLNEVRSIRLRMIEEFLANPSPKHGKRIAALDRYEKLARRAQKKALKALREQLAR